jgi:hypothetical protein
VTRNRSLQHLQDTPHQIYSNIKSNLQQHQIYPPLAIKLISGGFPRAVSSNSSQLTVSCIRLGNWMLIVCGCVPSDLSRGKCFKALLWLLGHLTIDVYVLPKSIRLSIPKHFNSVPWFGCGSGPCGQPPSFPQVRIRLQLRSTLHHVRICSMAPFSETDIICAEACRNNYMFQTVFASALGVGHVLSHVLS